ncbi:Glycogen synthase [Burkholderiales bacterium 8X]|nr:Glycogen synthase [Burkholderiales bacterium 8X]
MAAAEAPGKVLITADTVGGVWTHVLELAQLLGARGIEVAIAAMGDPVSASQQAQVAALRTRRPVRLHARPLRLEWMEDPWPDLQRAGDWLLAIERQWKPDVVHLNQFAFGALPFAAPKLVVAHSCVLSWWRAVHGKAAPSTTDRYRALVAEGLAGASLVGAPTRAMLATLTQNYGYAGPGVVLPNARSPEVYAPAPKEPLVLSAGRLWDAAKNLAALESVAPRLRWPVAVAGQTAQPTGGVRKPCGVRALGELAPTALAEYLARAAIYALPARYEPFGQSALEAGMCGCALVLGDIESLREVWGRAALYVPPDDHEALHAALQRLMGDEPLRRRMGRKAMARAALYSPKRMTDAYLAAYATVQEAASKESASRRLPARMRGTSLETLCAS